MPDTDPEILLSRIRAILMAAGREGYCDKCGMRVYFVLNDGKIFENTAYTLDGENHVNACKGKGSENG